MRNYFFHRNSVAFLKLGNIVQLNFNLIYVNEQNKKLFSLFFFCFFLSFFPTEMCLFQWHLLKAQFFLLNCFDIPVKKINPFYKNNPVVTSPPSQWAIFYILNMYHTICVHVALIPKIKVSNL